MTHMRSQNKLEIEAGLVFWLQSSFIFLLTMLFSLQLNTGLILTYSRTPANLSTKCMHRTMGQAQNTANTLDNSIIC